ncbi:MAG: DNA gyrase inhibitor YacG [Burkholderiaceae bacterium]
MASSTPRVIRCPGCGGPSVYASTNDFRPFCSARCKNNDFGAWASGAYAVDADCTPKDPTAGDEPDESAPTTH